MYKDILTPINRRFLHNYYFNNYIQNVLFNRVLFFNFSWLTSLYYSILFVCCIIQSFLYIHWILKLFLKYNVFIFISYFFQFLIRFVLYAYTAVPGDYFMETYFWSIFYIFKRNLYHSCLLLVWRVFKLECLWVRWDRLLNVMNTSNSNSN